MRSGSWYIIKRDANDILIRVVGRERTKSGRIIYHVWQYEPYNGPVERTTSNFNVVLADGKKWKYKSYTDTFIGITGRLTTVHEVKSDVEYWNMTLEQFQKAVRAQSYSRPMYTDPKYFSQRNARRNYYYLYINRQTLQIQKEAGGTIRFESENDSWIAKKMAYEYIIKQAREQGMLASATMINRSRLRVKASELYQKLIAL